MDPKTPPPGHQLQIELAEDVAQGTYSNLVFCTHSTSEFIFDFARVLPGARKGKVYSRIVMTPQHAKALAQLLERNIDTFENQHGTINVAGADDPRIGFDPAGSEPENGRPEG